VAVDITNIIGTANTITSLSMRTLEASNAKVAGYGTRKMAKKAELESRRVVVAAVAELAQAAMERWVTYLYDRSDDGKTWWNVRSDNMIWLAAPWSRSRYSAYQLSERQGRLLLRIRIDNIDPLPERMKLYVYSEMHQRFFLNRHRYPTLESALEWQRTVGAISAEMWHEFSERYPGGRL
jgi:hypothetical protein